MLKIGGNQVAASAQVPALPLQTFASPVTPSPAVAPTPKKKGKAADAEKVLPSPQELQSVLMSLRKQYGSGVVTGSEAPIQELVPTGIFELDHALGGGIPKGKLSIFYGPRSSTKSAAAMSTARGVQQQPGPCNVVAWIDVEHQFDPVWFAAAGLDVSKIILVRPAYGEEAADIVEALTQVAEIALIVIDSIANMTAVAEVQRTAEKADVGTQSGLVKRMTCKLMLNLAREERRGHSPTVLYINQRRFKIGVMFGDPETMPGGEAPQFLASLIVRFYGKDKIVKELDPHKPTLKEVSGVIKKSRQVINSVNFDYEMLIAVVPGSFIRPTQTRSWGLVSTVLKNEKLLTGGSGQPWAVAGRNFPKQEQVRHAYYTDPGFQLTCQQLVIAASKKNPTGAVDLPDGEIDLDE